MRRRTLVPLLLAATTLVPSGPAQAAPTGGPDGYKCGLSMATDVNPDAPPYDMVGVITVGPLVVTEPGELSTGTAYCTLKDGDSHDYPNYTFSWPSATWPDGVNVRHDVISTNRGWTAYLCTRFVYHSGETYYWDADAKAWSTDDAVGCNDVVESDTGTPRPRDARNSLCPHFGLVPPFAHTLRDLNSCTDTPSSNTYLWDVEPDL